MFTHHKGDAETKNGFLNLTLQRKVQLSVPLILPFMTDHVNRRPREQESLMEKMLQMCSDWNWDQPTSEKFPVLELLRHSFGESQTLPGTFMDHPRA